VARSTRHSALSPSASGTTYLLVIWGGEALAYGVNLRRGSFGTKKDFHPGLKRTMQVRIKCRDYVKKIAVYKDRLAVQVIITWFACTTLLSAVYPPGASTASGDTCEACPWNEPGG
jgi:hypothetical protein